MPENRPHQAVESDILTLRDWYEDHKADGGGYFEYLGLPAHATWPQFRDRYVKDGVTDIDKAAEDLVNYPPIRASIAELEAAEGRKET